MAQIIQSEKEVRIEFITYEATEIAEPLETKDGKNMYIVAAFGEVNDVISQSRDYKKVFFANTHSKPYAVAEQAKADGTPNKLKIRAAKIWAECPPYYVIIDGKRQQNKKGEDVQAKGVSLFLLPDEKFITEYDRTIRDLEFVDYSGEGIDSEEKKADNLTKP